ncbi:MAG TPA: phospholipase A2 [Amycolatopsis sp.]|uniref:phospholipase A2 n=1 Tax=Amycolatopsis sp. TaxID=37632 RepID=UPI002B48F608|nr:phospholipase A2 [Amycolatopsis sp.]HKS44361.1 phospholipase A2 [Amycolatopsis sp.]
MTAAAEIPRARNALSTSAWMLVLAIGLLGFGFVASRPAAPPDRPLTGGALAAQRAIESLASPGAQPTALSLLPSDFTQVTGVVPGVTRARDGTVRVVHTDGGCSAPWGDDNTKWDYGVPCKAHDLGYDLLRYADHIGQPLPASARSSLDARLSADMHNTCRLNPMGSPRTCQIVASLYSFGLEANSWHQRWGPPVGDPIGPLLTGIAAIGCLLVFRMRGWLHGRRSRPAERPAAPVGAASSWVTLGVASLVLLIFGESVIALARWAGAGDGVLWPFTWLAQLAPVFFFAGGRVNADGWRAEAGHGYRHFLAHRVSWLLRPALVFVVVALVVPVALELLGIPGGTNAGIVRIAMHPLWLLSVYLLTVVATPVMLVLYRRARVATLLGLLGFVVLGDLGADWLGSPVPRYLAAFSLALLAQQLAFGRLPGKPTLLAGTLTGTAGLALWCTAGGDPTLLGTPSAPPALAANAVPLLLLGAVQLSVLALFARPLAKLAARRALGSAVRFALRAPMSLYLGFLAAMLLVVAIVYLPASPVDAVAWLVRPRSVTALAMLAVPAVIVFWWFERHSAGLVERHDPLHLPRPSGWLAHAATALGIGFASLGLFGFALTRFGGDAGTTLLGMPLDPVQNLIQLLLGVFLLHTVRIGTSSAASTWVVACLVCMPPLLEASDGYESDLVTVALHGFTALFALVATVSTLIAPRTVAQTT